MNIIERIDGIITFIIGILYQPYIVPLLLLAGGLYFTFRTKFMQVRLLGEAFRVIKDKPKTKGGISSFGALMVSTASRVGTGNIIGVSIAICVGGPGAVFWMWITSILGGASAFVESTLAQIYKRKNPDGSSHGGPAFYMESGLKKRWLGVLFAIFILLTYALGYNMLASYNLQSAFAVFDFYDKATPYIIGAILAILFGIIVLGGAKRLVKVTEVMVPIMGLIYVIVAIVVLIINSHNIGAMFGKIFHNAFDFQAIFGGFAGSCLMLGIKRGLYSNEAGMGSAPNAAATADVSHPVKQGLVQMLSVFIDTLLICTATAFMCLSTDVIPKEELQGAPYVQESLSSVMGAIGPIFITVAMSLFAFTTLIGNYSYCEGCIKFIINKNPSKNGLILFRLLATLVVFLGSIATAKLVWDLADLTQALMVVVNMPVILILGNRAFRSLKDYVDQRKDGNDPVYNAKKCGIQEKLDFWNE